MTMIPSCDPNIDKNWYRFQSETKLRLDNDAQPFLTLVLLNPELSFFLKKL